MASLDFDAFLRDNEDRLRRRVRAIARRSTDAEDLLQEALLRAYVQRDRFESAEHAVNFVCLVVRGLLSNERKSWYRRSVTAYAEIDDALVEAVAEDPAELVAAREAQRVAIESLARLPVEHRSLLWEHEVDGVSYADIARRTETPLATVRSVAHRARLLAQRAYKEINGAIAALPVQFRARCAALGRYAVSGDGVAALLTVVGALLVGTTPATAPVPAGPSPVTAPTSLAGAVARAPEVSIQVPGVTDARVPGLGRAPDPVPPVGPPPSEPAEGTQAAQFDGPYASHCTFQPRSDDVVAFADYTCDFSGESAICLVSDDESAGECSVELLSLRLVGSSVTVPRLDVLVTAYRCNEGRITEGTAVYRATPGAPAVRFALKGGIDFTSRVLTLSGLVTRPRSAAEARTSFSANIPFSCTEHADGASGFAGRVTRDLTG
jgi:RNA polymerase sigma-70 factor (ECF subfamily)